MVTKKEVREKIVSLFLPWIDAYDVKKELKKIADVTLDSILDSEIETKDTAIIKSFVGEDVDLSNKTYFDLYEIYKSKGLEGVYLNKMVNKFNKFSYREVIPGDFKEEVTAISILLNYYKYFKSSLGRDEIRKLISKIFSISAIVKKEVPDFDLLKFDLGGNEESLIRELLSSEWEINDLNKDINTLIEYHSTAFHTLTSLNPEIGENILDEGEAKKAVIEFIKYISIREDAGLKDIFKRVPKKLLLENLVKSALYLVVDDDRKKKQLFSFKKVNFQYIHGSNFSVNVRNKRDSVEVLVEVPYKRLYVEEKNKDLVVKFGDDEYKLDEVLSVETPLFGLDEETSNEIRTILNEGYVKKKLVPFEQLLHLDDDLLKKKIREIKKKLKDINEFHCESLIYMYSQMRAPYDVKGVNEKLRKYEQRINLNLDEAVKGFKYVVYAMREKAEKLASLF